MKKELEKIKKEFLRSLAQVKDRTGLEELEHIFFSRKAGKITLLMKQLKGLTAAEKKKIGPMANELKKELLSSLATIKKKIDREQFSAAIQQESIDVTQPRFPATRQGHMHPHTQLMRDLNAFFTSMGYLILHGPELESDYYNFQALNYSEDHPARDAQDTFYIKDHPSWVMRTQTSPMQIRALRKYGAPLRAVVPGRCFRNEATDVRHEHTFYQLEGLVVGEDIAFTHLKGVLVAMTQHLYGEDAKVRLRPKFYPFVEPGQNYEISCSLCKGEGCRLCKHTGWLEVGGSGMVHPNVLKAGNIDPEKYSGFAFGFGTDRLVMLKYGIEDIRHFFAGDMRFLKQF